MEAGVDALEPHVVDLSSSELWSKLLEGGIIGDYIGESSRGY